MKLIDRYVIASFLKNYLISFLVLVGMYVVLDMIFNFDELVEVNRQAATGPAAVLAFAGYVGDFYFYQIFLYFVHLSGMIPVVAAAFTLMRMVRFNELSALLSAGVPLLRLAMPIIVVSILLNGLLWADQELLIPNMIPKLIRKHDYGSEDGKSYPLSAMRDEVTGAKLFAGAYYPNENPPRMAYISIVLVDANNVPISHIRADKAIWNPTGPTPHWQLVNGLIDTNLSPESSLPIQTKVITDYTGGITPEEIQLFRSSDFVELLSTGRINELLQRQRSYGQAALLRVKHGRGVVQMLVNTILLLLAISATLTREPQQLKQAAAWCVGLCGACLTTAFFAQEMAGRPPSFLSASFAVHWPALMAWLPIFIFGPLAVWMLDRVKT